MKMSPASPRKGSPCHPAKVKNYRFSYTLQRRPNDEELCTSRFVELVDFSNLQYTSTTKVSNTWETVVSWIDKNSTCPVLPVLSFWTITSIPCNFLYVLSHDTRTKQLNISLSTVKAIFTLRIETINPPVPQHPVQSPGRSLQNVAIINKQQFRSQRSQHSSKNTKITGYHSCSTVIKCVKGSKDMNALLESLAIHPQLPTTPKILACTFVRGYCWQYKFGFW